VRCGVRTQLKFLVGGMTVLRSARKPAVSGDRLGRFTRRRHHAEYRPERFFDKRLATASGEIMHNGQPTDTDKSASAAASAGKQPDVVHYQRLLESTNAIPWEWDLASGRFSFMGPQMAKTLGYPMEHWYEKNFWEQHIHDDDRAWVPAFCADATRRGDNHELEYRMVAADGRVVWFRDYVNVVQGEQGPVALQGYMFDVTERRQAEEIMEALARTGAGFDTEEFFRSCVRNLAMVYDARYAFIGLVQAAKDEVRTVAVWAGTQFAENFTYKLDGTPCKDILDHTKELIPSGASTLYAQDDLLVQMGVDSYFGAPLISSEGETMGLVSVMDVKPMALTRWSAPILGVFATRIAMEIERKAASDALRALNASLEERVRERTLELEAANRELEAFCYSVSHDLRAPLRAVMGFSQAIMEDYGATLDDTARSYLMRISDGSAHMRNLIEDLLQLSRVARGEIERVPVLLSQLAETAIAELRDVYPGRNVRFVNSHRGKVMGDPRLLGIVLQNLLGNAWKYTGKTDDPLIEFGSLDETDRPVHFVRDNGVGFNASQVDRLFRPFQRLHRDDEFEGSGIGLATVHRIIQRHGGKVWADAQPGVGAVFYFSLPSCLT
jgi:PAS domain S-box-containing protein